MIPDPQVAVELNTSTKTNTTLYLGLGLLLVFIMSARSPLDTDMWWHLRAGEWMINHAQPLLVDTFSYTRVGTAWTNHSWLAEIIIFLFYKAGGAFGLSLFTALLATLSMGLLYPLMKGHPLYKAFLLVLLTPVAAMVWSPRPQMFSLVLLAATSLLLHQYITRRTRKIWLLIPLFILWSNLHGGYALGLFLAGAVILGSLGDHLMGHGRESLTKQDIVRLLLWTTAAWIAVVINPNGINAWLIPFKTVGVNSLQNFISEWASPDFHQIVQWPFFIILFLLVFAIGNSRRRLTGFEFTLMVVFSGLALIAVRNFGPFAIVSGPILSIHLWQALREWLQRIKHKKLSIRLMGYFRFDPYASPKNLPDSLRRVINGLLIMVLLAAGMMKLSLTSSRSFLEKAKLDYYPVGAVNWIAENLPAGRMLSSYNWGGYLTWTLPEYPVFIDGRTDLYGDDLIQDWLTVIQAENGWEDMLDHWDVSLVLLEPNRPIVQALSVAGWDQLYRDDNAVLLRK